jgi:hypothetical protein
MRVTVAVPPIAIVPRAHDMFPVAPTGGVMQLPCVVVAFRNWDSEGRVSVTATPVAARGPRFRTKIENVTVFGAAEGFEGAAMLTARSPGSDATPLPRSATSLKSALPQSNGETIELKHAFTTALPVARPTAVGVNDIVHG